MRKTSKKIEKGIDRVASKAKKLSKDAGKTADRGARKVSKAAQKGADRVSEAADKVRRR